MIDLTLINFLILISFIAYRFLPETGYYFLPLYIGLTFFLFCNIFRIGKKLEIFWYVPFVIITFFLFHRPDIYWKVLLPVCETIKVVLIIYRIIKGPYKGAFCKK
jgi:hypothetical protein